AGDEDVLALEPSHAFTRRLGGDRGHSLLLVRLITAALSPAVSRRYSRSVTKGAASRLSSTSPRSDSDDRDSARARARRQDEDALPADRRARRDRRPPHGR